MASPKKLKLADLTEVERDVVIALTGRKSVPSTVGLASELWSQTNRWGHDADPVGLVAYLVRELCTRGLLTYREDVRHRKPRQGEVHDPYSDLPHTIRLTPLGWDVAGYPLMFPTAGTRLSRQVPTGHMGDRTNFRHHDIVAKGVGPIEVDTFAEHRVLFPHHIHMYSEGEDQMSTPQTPEKRSYLKVTADMEARVLILRTQQPTASYDELAEAADLPERSIKYILVDLPRLRRLHGGDQKAAKSLKERVFGVIDALGEVKDAAELRRVLGANDDEHNIVHVLHSLRKQGRVDFEDRGNGRANQPVNIRVHRSQRAGKLSNAELRQQAPVVPVPETEAPAQPPETAADAPAPEPRPEPNQYPLLDGLLEREAKRLEGDSKGMAYVVAAEAIEKVDPDMARELMAKAKVHDVPYPSPTEAEYLRWVADHS